MTDVNFRVNGGLFDVGTLTVMEVNPFGVTVLLRTSKGVLLNGDGTVLS